MGWETMRQTTSTDHTWEGDDRLQDLFYIIEDDDDSIDGIERCHIVIKGGTLDILTSLGVANVSWRYHLP